MELPESLRIPNIELRNKTIEQLVAEQTYWQTRIDNADGWRRERRDASVSAAIRFRDACAAELTRRGSA